jgi:hypothetical protein
MSGKQDFPEIAAIQNSRQRKQIILKRSPDVSACSSGR